ncbi:MAG: hypothetical protein K0R18_1713 [Bacillales bacterium]|jgi:predicted ribosome quality control (RQC) complex YloA/Tae2 family protein|nr:hypothetical protein [Bacillales bacterium]
MAFDGLFTKAMTNELSQSLTGGRINKIHQPSNNEILMVIRANGKNHRLLISAHSSYARVQITNEPIENPHEAPMFCMLLRKHLEGFFIEEIVQPELERIIILKVRGRNEIGDLTSKQLIVEIMGKHSNILLVDANRNLILDCIKHVPPAMNSYRTLLPGQSYLAPPTQEKINPLKASSSDLENLNFKDENSSKELVNRYAGISPFFAKNIVSFAEFEEYLKKLKHAVYFPSIMNQNGKESYYIWPIINNADELKTFHSLSEMLDRFYFGKAERDRVKQQSQDLSKLLQNEKEKNEKKIVKLEETLVEADKADLFKKYGELLTANLYNLKRGMKSAEVVDYYVENQEKISIVLDTRKTPNENAQSFFMKYQKAKKSVEFVVTQIDLAKKEIFYLDNVLHQIQNASPSDLAEIREELEDQKYLRARKVKKKKAISSKPVLDKFESSNGTEILVGRNNIQNEFLTMKLAGRNQLWFHTKDIPGSHVVIRSEEPSDETILEAAGLAVYFSKARESSNVPVDYTLIRHVKKPSGAKPGFVTYDNQKTLYVTPSEELVLKLRR